VFKLAIPRHQPEIIRAIEQSRSPVTAGDVAIATGMNLVLVEQALLALAVDGGAICGLLAMVLWPMSFPETSRSFWPVVIRLNDRSMFRF
jgi:hypothetical protein